MGGWVHKFGKTFPPNFFFFGGGGLPLFVSISPSNFLATHLYLLHLHLLLHCLFRVHLVLLVGLLFRFLDPMCFCVHFTERIAPDSQCANIHKCTLEQHAGWKKLRNHSGGCAQKVKISTKGSVPNIRYFVVNSRSSCFRRYLNNAFVEISTKGFILL